MATGDRAILLSKLGARARIIQAQLAIIAQEYVILGKEVEALCAQLEGYIPPPTPSLARSETDG